MRQCAAEGAKAPESICFLALCSLHPCPAWAETGHRAAAYLLKQACSTMGDEEGGSRTLPGNRGQLHKAVRAQACQAAPWRMRHTSTSSAMVICEKVTPAS